MSLENRRLMPDFVHEFTHICSKSRLPKYGLKNQRLMPLIYLLKVVIKCRTELRGRLCHYFSNISLKAKRDKVSQQIMQDNARIRA